MIWLLHLTDAVNFGDPFLDVVALVGHRHLSGERDRAVLHHRVDVVEDRELRVVVDGCRDVVEDLQIFALAGVGERDTPIIKSPTAEAQFSKHVPPPKFLDEFW